MGAVHPSSAAAAAGFGDSMQRLEGRECRKPQLGPVLCAEKPPRTKRKKPPPRDRGDQGTPEEEDLAAGPHR